MTETAQLVNHALRLHQAGDLPSAENLYRTVLQQDPRNGDALHLLGTLRGRLGWNEDGIRLIEEAIAVNPRVSAYFNNLGNLKIKAGDLLGAEESYRRAVRLDRKNADAHLNLGKLHDSQHQPSKARDCYVAALRLAPRSVEAHMSLGRLEEAQGKIRAALESFRNAVRLAPRDSAAHLALGNAQVKLHSFDQAEISYRTAIEIDPQYADAHFNLANTLRTQERPAEAVPVYRQAIALSGGADADIFNSFGATLADLEQYEEAMAAHRKAIELRPDFDDAFFNLGKQLTTSANPFHDAEQGIQMLRKAIAINPANAPAHLQLGVALYALGFLHEAIEASRTSLDFDPSCPVAKRNLGMALSHVGDAAGIEMLQQALLDAPDSPDLHWNLAEELLLHGRYEEGLREYEWRVHVKELSWQYRPADVPLWTGEPLSGKRLLLYAEQGFGDTLQFARYARLVADRGATVILEVPGALQRWCAALPGVSECVAQGTPLPDFDLALPLMSLPHRMDTRLETIPPPVTAAYTDKRRPGAPLQVGIVWAGNGKHVRDRLRSTQLSQWNPLAQIDGVEFTSLQVGQPVAQIEQGGHGFQFVDDCRNVRDFADTAEIIAGLDLVITVDTAVAHLAGSMGKPVWILLYNAVDWRWGLERPDTPWYPTAKLFRQTTPADWSEVFGQLEANLRAVVIGRAGDQPLLSNLRNDGPDLSVSHAGQNSCQAPTPLNLPASITFQTA